MKADYWHSQTEKPLFPNLLWSRPETRLGAGKLLIIGGQAQEFIHVAESHSAADRAGAGTIRVLMPSSTRRITKMLPNIEYASANSSGSFARDALSELIDASLWADGVLLAGDLGRNSETTLMLEKFSLEYGSLLVINQAALASLPSPAKSLFNRPETVISLSFNELQKRVGELGLIRPITSRTANNELAQILHEITAEYAAHLIVSADGWLWTAGNGQVVSTKPKADTESQKSISQLTATSAVWAAQNPGKLFEAVTTAVYC